jgi:WD40 repeat protein
MVQQIPEQRLRPLDVVDHDDQGRVVDAAEIDRNGLSPTSTPMLFSPDGSLLVTVGGVGGATGPSGTSFFASGRIRVLDVASGETVARVDNVAAEATALALSPDGSVIAVGYEGGLVEVRSLPGIEEVCQLAAWSRSDRDVSSNRTVRQAVFSSDGEHVRVMNTLGETRTFHSESCEVSDVGDVPVESYVELMPDGSLVGGSDEGEVRVYGSDGEQLGAPLTGHGGPILDVAVGGGVFATLSLDGTMRLWDRESHQPIGAPIPTDSPVVDLSPDGRWLAAIAEGVTRLWDLEPRALVDAACAAAGRNLTRQEWDRYLPSNEPYRPTCPQWPDPTIT